MVLLPKQVYGYDEDVLDHQISHKLGAIGPAFYIRLSDKFSPMNFPRTWTDEQLQLKATRKVQIVCVTQKYNGRINTY